MRSPQLIRLIAMLFTSLSLISKVSVGATLADYLLAHPDGSSAGIQDNMTERNLSKYAQAMSDKAMFEKPIQITVEQLKDNAGLVYIGGKVSKATLMPYLEQLKDILSEDFASFREHQARRDHHSFHVTLINPFEYQNLNPAQVVIGQQLNVRLIGLGKAEKADKAAFFVVAESSDGQFYRQQYQLKAKDFHVTLGFKPTDVFGVSKGRDSLIQ